MAERKIIEINHALSGVHGKQVKLAAQKLTDSRKQIIKRLQRKKKLASVIQDELYWYLQRYPEQKQGLHKQAIKKKKNKINPEHQELTKLTYSCPSIQTVDSQYLLKNEDSNQKIVQKFSKWFQFTMDLEMTEEKTE